MCLIWQIGTSIITLNVVLFIKAVNKIEDHLPVPWISLSNLCYMTHSIYVRNMKTFAFSMNFISMNFLCLPSAFAGQVIMDFLDVKCKIWYLKLSNRSTEPLKFQVHENWWLERLRVKASMKIDWNRWSSFSWHKRNLFSNSKSLVIDVTNTKAN